MMSSSTVSTMSHNNPNSIYDISREDYDNFTLFLSSLSQAKATTFNSDTGTGMSLFPTSSVASGPTFPSSTYSGGVSPFPYPSPSLTGASSGESSTSLASPPTLPCAPPNYFLSQPQPYLWSEADHAPPLAPTSRPRKRKADELGLEDPEFVRRPRGPNRKRPGTGYADMMEKLPQEVQEALQQDYPGCCQNVNKKDNSTLCKHRFSNRHFSQLPKELQDMLPAYICPAFLAMHTQCPTAKAGRYDSTERHCKSCPGFHEMKQSTPVWPIEITKGEFKAFQEFRKGKSPGPIDVQANPPVESAVEKLLDALKDGALESPFDFGVPVSDIAPTGGAQVKVEELDVVDGFDNDEGSLF